MLKESEKALKEVGGRSTVAEYDDGLFGGIASCQEEDVEVCFAVSKWNLKVCLLKGRRDS